MRCHPLILLYLGSGTSHSDVPPGEFITLIREILIFDCHLLFCYWDGTEPEVRTHHLPVYTDGLLLCWLLRERPGPWQQPAVMSLELREGSCLFFLQPHGSLGCSPPVLSAQVLAGSSLTSLISQPPPQPVVIALLSLLWFGVMFCLSQLTRT